MPRVSVVVTCYNYGHFLPDAVESLAAQTFREFETVIVNDGSKDNSADVARELIDRYSLMDIKLIDQPNAGVSAARNNGIRESSGEYVVVLDADDMLAPEFLEETVAALDSRPDIGIAYTMLSMFSTGGVQDDNTDYRGEPYDLNTLMKGNYIPNSSLFRKKAWVDVGGYKDMHYEDYEIWIAMGEAGYPGILVPKRLCLYRKHGPSRSLDYEAEYLRYMYGVKMLHPKLYAPFLSRRLPKLVPLYIYLHTYVRDPISHFVYRKLPGLHEALRKMKEAFTGPPAAGDHAG